MKLVAIVAMVGTLLVGGLVVGAAAQQPGWGPMMGQGGWGPMMGPGAGPMAGRFGMMQGRWAGGGAGCPGLAAATAAPATPDAAAAVTEDKARELATEYAGKYFKNYTVERVLPFQGRAGTAYQVELKGPKGESRTLHVNPWGAVRPFAMPFAAME